jgi:RNA polymerase sigma factor (sigma-70 family)
MISSGLSDSLHAFAVMHSGDSFRVLVEAHAGMVTGIAQRITGSRETAEEVAQDVFMLLAHRAAALARGDAPLSAWLHRTATYMALNARKREKRRNAMLEKAMHELPQTGEATDSPDWLPQLDDALKSLSPPDRQLVLMHHASGYTLTETAAELGLSMEAAKKRGQRAIDRLRCAMQRIRRGAAGPSGPRGQEMIIARVPFFSAVPSSRPRRRGNVVLNFLHALCSSRVAAAVVAGLALGNVGCRSNDFAAVPAEAESLRAPAAKAAWLHSAVHETADGSVL